MSYVRFGQDSDIYLIGIIDNGRQVIECCGCLFSKRGPWPGPDPEPTIDGKGGFKDWVLESYPKFGNKAAACQHVRNHKGAGHKVPDYVIPSIQEDDWIES